jgi:hypothetical protein
MKRFDSSDDRDEALPPRLARAVALLRDEPAVPTRWRDELVRRTAAIRRRRRLIRATAAVLAAGLCAAAVLGRSHAWLRVHGPHARDTSASALAVAPPRAASVRFTLEAPHAAHVSLVGDFDGWKPAGVPMSRAGDGRTWIVDVPLPPGRHAFAFSVDGGLRVDPRAPRAGDDDFGTPSSVIVVPQAGDH